MNEDPRFLRRARGISRRTALAAASAGCFAPAAWAQVPAAGGYPTKPVRLMVGFAAGGGTDVTARLFAQKVSPHLGQTMVAENRAGAAGSIAAVDVAKSEPDGYKLLMLASGTFIHAALSSRVPYNIERDFTPISMVTFAPLVVVVGPSVTARTVGELLDFARANPGKLTFGSDGVGATSHLAGEMLNTFANVKTVHVPFKGNAEAMVAVGSGQVDIGFPSLASARPLLQSGRVRALAVTSLKRSSLLPELSTMDEYGLRGFDIAAWFAFIGPAGLPPAIVARLNAAIAAAASQADTKDALNQQNLEVTVGTPEQLAAFFKEQNAIISRLGREAGIKLE